jgi:peptidoglycan/xylan/chitin deacetylase (PgdA/CDA1 family)
MTSNLPCFLIGIDLEPLPLTDRSDETSWNDLHLLTDVILSLLRAHEWKATFFTVGLVAARRPSLVAAIVNEGHEIACHTYAHRRVDQLSPAEFERDLARNLEVLGRAGAKDVIGFRAPFFSLTERGSAAVYRALKTAGIRYSSSVSESRNLPGWAERAVRLAGEEGVVELPVSSLWPAPPGLPVGIPMGGLYWRCCPDSLLMERVQWAARQSGYVSSFFHPHDFHSGRAKYISAGSILRNPLFAALLAVGRRSVEHKLELVRALGFSFLPFREYLEGEGVGGSRT